MLVVRTGQFKFDIDLAVTHIMSYATDAFADKFQNRLNDLIDSLAISPNMGRIYNGQGSHPVRRLIVNGTKYSIFYTIIDDKIVLLNLVHGSSITR